MNSTNVPSSNNQKSKIRLTGGNTQFTEKEAKVNGIDTGSIELGFEFSAGPAVLTPDGTLHIKGGKNLAMKNPNAYENVKKAGKERRKLTKPTMTTGIDR